MESKQKKHLTRRRLFTGIAILGIALVALLAVPAVTFAESSQSTEPDPPATAADCEALAANGEFPRMTEFLAELVTDGVIDQSQSDEIDARFREKAEYRCVLHVLFPKREAFQVTADATGVTRRDVVRGMIGGASLTEYAADHGVDEATLTEALMAAPRQRASDMVTAGHLTQDEANDLLADVQTYIGELIHAEGLRGFAHTRW